MNEKTADPQGDERLLTRGTTPLRHRSPMASTHTPVWKYPDEWRLDNGEPVPAPPTERSKLSRSERGSEALFASFPVPLHSYRGSLY